MRKIALFFLLFLPFLRFAAAEENFYLNTRTPPQKLIPSTLSCTLQPGESARLTVDLLPRGADTTRLAWSITPSDGLAAILWNEGSCTVQARGEGTGLLTVRDPDGAQCEIRLTVRRAAASLRLSATAETVQIGDEVRIRALAEPADAEIVWSVDAQDAGAVSYGGSLCKIQAAAPGAIHVRADIRGSGVHSDYTLRVLPAQTQPPAVLTLVSRALFCGAAALLTLALGLFLFQKARRIG